MTRELTPRPTSLEADRPPTSKILGGTFELLFRPLLKAFIRSCFVRSRNWWLQVWTPCDGWGTRTRIQILQPCMLSGQPDSTDGGHATTIAAENMVVVQSTCSPVRTCSMAAVAVLNSLTHVFLWSAIVLAVVLTGFGFSLSFAGMSHLTAVSMYIIVLFAPLYVVWLLARRFIPAVPG